MSSKTVKITNGKIVNYTISADGYKTINGSKLITNDDTININMIPSSDTNGVYSLGDRIGDCATFVCYFNSTDPNTNLDKTYAVFVLDAKYRTNANWGVDSYTGIPITGIPIYNPPTDVKPSATWFNDALLENCRQAGISPTCINVCRQNSIVVNGQRIEAQLLNAKELLDIYGPDSSVGLQHRQFLDSKDPTVNDYPSFSIVNCYNNYTWTSTVMRNGNNTGAWFSYIYYSSLNWSWHGQREYDSTWGSNYQVIPVFEIPVE